MNYNVTVGIEVHCELKTNNKIFSPSKSLYGSMANTNVNVIDLGYPGVLPQLNREVLEYAIRDAKENGKSGIWTLTSKKKKPLKNY